MDSALWFILGALAVGLLSILLDKGWVVITQSSEPAVAQPGIPEPLDVLEKRLEEEATALREAEQQRQQRRDACAWIEDFITRNQHSLRQHHDIRLSAGTTGNFYAYRKERQLLVMVLSDRFELHDDIGMLKAVYFADLPSQTPESIGKHAMSALLGAL